MTSPRTSRDMRIPLATLLTGLVLGSVLLVVLAVAAVNYYFNTRFAEQAAEEEFTNIALRSTQAAARLSQRGERIAVALRAQDALDTAIGQTLHPMVRPMTQMMSAADHIFSLFLGRANGNYLEVSDLDEAPELREAWGATDSERWVAIQIFGRAGDRIELRHFLDASLNVLRTQERPSSFLSYERPWYQNARPEVVRRTPPYVLSLIQQRGISYTVGDDAGIVSGAIVLLSSLDSILSSNRFPSSFAAMIFDAEGRIIAGSGPEDTLQGVSSTSEISDAPIYKALADVAATAHGRPRLLEISAAGEPYYTWVQPVESFGGADSREYVGISGSRREVMAGYVRRELVALAVSLGLALCLLPAVFMSTRLISQPMRRLAQESRKVRYRQYDDVQQVPTSIREVGWLSDSMVSMAGAIQDYEQKQRDLHDGFVKLIAAAIDQKSPYTGGHCARVPAIANRLAAAASAATDPPFADFSLDGEAEQREFQIAAWLHDCGKITTPEHIVDKGAKLETIYNRIHEIRMRFEVLLRDAEIDFLRRLAQRPDEEDTLRGELTAQIAAIRDDFAFVARCNVGGEFMDDADLERLQGIASRTWRRMLDDRLGLSPLEASRLTDFPSETPAEEPLLADKAEHEIPREGEGTRFDDYDFTMRPPPLKQNLGELYNLGIRRGTLTPEDRYLINEHICSTIEMLETLPWPDDLTRVTEIAGGHHEKMDGTGYPRGLNSEELSLAARIMAIADVFEALTAADRPYKAAKSLSQSLGIMRKMALEAHIDADLFRLFVESGTYLAFAHEWMDPAQIDDVDEAMLVEGIARTSEPRAA